MARQKPTLVRAKIINSDGSTAYRTVRLDDVKSWPQPRHDVLAPDLVRKATAVYWRCARITGDCTLDKFLDLLRYDMHPEREVAIWEHIAACLERLGGAALGPRRQRQTARALLLISMGGVDVESQIGVSTAYAQHLRDLYGAHGA
jgi:hypothetical protein